MCWEIAKLCWENIAQFYQKETEIVFVCFQPNIEDRIGVIFLIRTINSTESMDEKKNQIVFSQSRNRLEIS